MSKVLVVAPHADDESLGCAGTLLKHIANGEEVHWMLVTGMTEESGFTNQQILTRNSEIATVAKMYGFAEVHELNLPPAALDTIPIGDVVANISTVVKAIEPEIVYTVYRNDAHSDHQIVFDCVLSSTKSFRYRSVKKVLAYETLSETDFGGKPEDGGFKPNVFVNITQFLSKKQDILAVYQSEMGEIPFPRSHKAIEALATLRGVQSGYHAAESFFLIKEIIE